MYEVRFWLLHFLGSSCFSNRYAFTDMLCVCVVFFYYSHPSGYEVVSHCGFDCTFLMAQPNFCCEPPNYKPLRIFSLAIQFSSWRISAQLWFLDVEGGRGLVRENLCVQCADFPSFSCFGYCNSPHLPLCLVSQNLQPFFFSSKQNSCLLVE